MPKQNNQVYVHLVWSTAGRQQALSPDIQAWLWPALAESARGAGSAFVVVGGADDHIHLLTQLPVTVSIAELVRRLKGASSRFLHQRGLADFAWQEGYAAFSVSFDQLPALEHYIRNQAEHHASGQTNQDIEIPT